MAPYIQSRRYLLSFCAFALAVSRKCFCHGTLVSIYVPCPPLAAVPYVSPPEANSWLLNCCCIEQLALQIAESTARLHCIVWVISVFLCQCCMACTVRTCDFSLSLWFWLSGNVILLGMFSYIQRDRVSTCISQ
jgi:hypothetical protein